MHSGPGPKATIYQSSPRLSEIQNDLRVVEGFLAPHGVHTITPFGMEVERLLQKRSFVEQNADAICLLSNHSTYDRFKNCGETQKFRRDHRGCLRTETGILIKRWKLSSRTIPAIYRAG